MDYIIMEQNPKSNCLNQFKNTFNTSIQDNSAVSNLQKILLEDLMNFSNLTVCIVPRAKAENTYSRNQLLFKSTVKGMINELNLHDGTNYIIRHTDTKTTHLNSHITRWDGSIFKNDGDEPYKGITVDTCTISDDVEGKNILLIDDIYTNGVNIDEDVIQALLHNGAKSVLFYAVAKA